MKKESSATEIASKPDEMSAVVSQKPTKFDPYQASLKFEEDEVIRRSEKEDQELYTSICKQIKSSMKEILKLKTEKPDQWAGEVEDRKVKVLMLMLSLRRLSRVQKVRVKNAREKTVEFRQSVDGATLKLQNLLYEVAHLKKEVRKCLEFQSADQEIDLVPIDQFYLEAPENISCPEETVSDPHQQRLAQLHWELEQRRGQTQLSDKLTQEKEKVASVIADQEEKLASLVPRISAILEATVPLQKALNLPMDAKRDQQRTSQLLPSPLYTLWVQASAYGEACDSMLTTEICGDVDAAKKLITSEDDTRTEASDSEGEMDSQEDNMARKSRSRNEKKVVDSDDSEDASLKQLLNLHPLYIHLNIRTREGNAVAVKFHYALMLRIVTTKCSLDLAESSKLLLTDVLNGDNLLNLLFPDDTGVQSPNPSNEYLLQKFRFSMLKPEHIKVIGKPYKWAQTLAGLSFLRCESSPCKDLSVPQQERKDTEETEIEDLFLDETNAESVPSSSSPPVKQYSETLSWKVSAEHMHHTITSIKRRLQARLVLHSQFQVLETASSTSCIPLSTEVLHQRFPGKVSSELRSWKPITWMDYESSDCTEAVVRCGAVNKHHLVFKAIFERKPVTLEAYVAVSPDYPNLPPVFSLMLQWNNKFTANTNPHVRQMESELNTYWTELVSNRAERQQILSLQLYRLAMCLDIFTEATSIQLEANSPQAQFHKEKIFFRPARGPDRALPFKYLPKLGVFAQR